MEFSKDQSLPTQNTQVLVTPHINVRCPSCFKLYNVDSKDISTKKPKFKCTKCEQKFWVSYPECLGVDEFLGYPELAPKTSFDDLQQTSEELFSKQASLGVEPLQAKGLDFDKSYETPTQLCSKCNTSYLIDQKDCHVCGVVIEKTKNLDSFKSETPVPKHVKLAWQAVLDTYEDPSLHDAFIKTCKDTHQLEFAAHKYTKILKAYPIDEESQKRVRQIENIVIVKSGLGLTPRLKTKSRRFRWNFLFMSIGLSMILIGYVIPQLRNMVGVGVAMTFLTLALRFYFK